MIAIAKKILLWLALLIPTLVVELAAFPFAPLIALLDEATAKKRFSWFLTPDNPMTGDAGHEARWAGKPIYFKKVAWLWRNRAYGFSHLPLVRARSLGPVTVNGNPAVSNRPFVEGLVIRTTAEGYWQFYYVKQTTRARCLRVNLGWKLWGSPMSATFGMYVFAVNPLMGFS